MGTPAAGKTKWRNPSVTERRRSGIDANAPVLTHSHAHRTPGTASRGLLRGVPTGAGRGPPGEGPGVSPARPQSSLSASSSPASPFPALAARPAHSLHSSVRVHGPRSHARSPHAPNPLSPHNSAARKRSPVPRYTQNQPLHTHIPPATPIAVALPSLTYPPSGGAEPSLSPIFSYQGMRFSSLCAGQRREPFLGLSRDQEWGWDFGLDRSNTRFTPGVGSQGRSASRWAGTG